MKMNRHKRREKSAVCLLQRTGCSRSNFTHYLPPALLRLRSSRSPSDTHKYTNLMPGDLSEHLYVFLSPSFCYLSPPLLSAQFEPQSSRIKHTLALKRCNTQYFEERQHNPTTGSFQWPDVDYQLSSSHFFISSEHLKGQIVILIFALMRTRRPENKSRQSKIGV